MDGYYAFMLVATAFVLVMTVPALALFYGGMTRSKSVLNMMMLSFVAFGVATLVFVLWGWSAGWGADGVGHVSFADPYCPRGRAAALGGETIDGGTLVVVNGPRFSSRAESKEFQSHGWSIIGMTAMPETSLARELGLCYTTLALVTDLDAGVEAGEGVTHAEVLATFAANLPRMRELLVTTLGRLPDAQGDCACGDRSGLPAIP